MNLHVTSHASNWVILRCKGASTLRLAQSLTDAGFEAWTPAGENALRHGRSRGRRKDMVAVMPTYVFARARHLVDLLGESSAATSDHPDFSVFRHFGQIPLIADASLDPLRVAERKRTPIDRVARFSRGDLVRCAEAGFQGLSGVVELTKGQFTLVCFPGFSLPIKIKSMLLLPEGEKRAA